jgi:hypothetical protein
MAVRAWTPPFKSRSWSRALPQKMNKPNQNNEQAQQKNARATYDHGSSPLASQLSVIPAHFFLASRALPSKHARAHNQDELEPTRAATTV